MHFWKKKSPVLYQNLRADISYCDAKPPDRDDTFFLVNNWPSPTCGKILKNLSIHNDNSLIWPLAKCEFLEFSLPPCASYRMIYMSFNEFCFPIFFHQFYSLISLFCHSLWSLISACLIKNILVIILKYSQLLFLCPSTCRLL